MGTSSEQPSPSLTRRGGKQTAVAPRVGVVKRGATAAVETVSAAEVVSKKGRTSKKKLLDVQGGLVVDDPTEGEESSRYTCV